MASQDVSYKECCSG